MANELSSIKSATQLQQNREHKQHRDYRDKSSGDDTFWRVDVDTKSIQCSLPALKVYENDSNSNSAGEKLKGSDASMGSARDKTVIEELKLNLKVKENLIDSINDALVLKEAEIARLKTRIGIMERTNIIDEINDYCK